MEGAHLPVSDGCSCQERLGADGLASQQGSHFTENLSSCFPRAAGKGLDKNKILRPVARRWFRDWRFTGLNAATAEARAQQACIIAIMALAQLSSTGVFSARFSAAPLRSTRHSVSLWPWLPYA